MRRRSFLTLGALAVAARPKLTIRSAEVSMVKVNHRGNWVIVRLATDEGVTGLGDASHARDAEVLRLLDQYLDLLRGRSPFDFEWFRAQVLQRGRPDRNAAVAMSALEQAMLDIQGQALGIPCFDLFGGPLRRTVLHYANINRCTVDRTPAGFSASAKRAIEAGFTIIKMAPFDGLPKPGAATFAAGVDQGVACVAAVREVIGAERELFVDGHSHFDLASGLELAKRLEPYRLGWLEETTPPPDLPAIEAAAKMPTAGGESIYGLSRFRDYLAARSVDILMPDVKYCGGMTELKRAAVLAESFEVAVSPHGPASPVGNAAAAQVCVTMPNFHTLELGFGEVDWRAELVDPPEAFDRGVMTLSDRPGLGIRLNDALIKKHRA
jgi:galactonate dehydratase